MKSFAIELGCNDLNDKECFQSKNTSEVLRASDKTINVPLSWSDAIQEWAPVVTGTSQDAGSMLMEPARAFAQGHVVKVPFISGSNADDGKLFSYALAGGASKKLISAEYVALIGGVFNENITIVPKILELYPPSVFGDNKVICFALKRRDICLFQAIFKGHFV